MLLLHTLGPITVHDPLYLPERYVSFMPHVNKRGFSSHLELAALEAEASKALKTCDHSASAIYAKDWRVQTRRCIAILSSS